jgi:hypothetical protein
MVESLRTKQPDLKRRRIQRDKNPASVPPSGAPSWCLTREALEKYNRSTENIPTYDYDTDDTNHDISQDDTENEESRKTTRKRKKKSKKKKKVKTSKHKK